MKKIISSIGGFFAGTLNGLLGAGGGMIIVPLLLKAGLDQKRAHATSVFIILPLSILSGALYLQSGIIEFKDAAPYLIWSIPGALIGTWILTKIKPKLLKRIFGILMIWASIRMLLR